MADTSRVQWSRPPSVMDRLVCALWVERRSSVAHLAELIGESRERVYPCLYELRRQDLVMHPSNGIYALTAAGVRRARYLVMSRGLFDSKGGE